MELAAGKIAVVTGAASGIGLALAHRFAAAGMHVVLADVDDAGLETAATEVGAHGVDTLTVHTDVSDEAAVQALAAATVDRFGGAHLVCNNAGVATMGDPWSGPLSSWTWTVGVNLWGVVHGVRAFLPVLQESGGHIVNTASMAGLMPGANAPYDATKHAVVALSEDLYLNLRGIGSSVGVSVLCPGWVRTRINEADRNFPADLEAPTPGPGHEIIRSFLKRVIDEGTPPAVIADLVADAVIENRFWILPHPDFVDVAVRRWHTIAEGTNPTGPVGVPGS